MRTKLLEYDLIDEKSYETKLKMSPFCRDWPSLCWTILKVNRTVKAILKDTLMVDPKIREFWIILLIAILATIHFIIIRRRRNNKQNLEAKLRQEERKKCFDEIINEMQEFTKKAETLDPSSGFNEDDPKNVDENCTSHSFTDSRKSVLPDKPEQMDEVSPRKTFTGSAKSKNKAARFSEANARTKTPVSKNVLLNSENGPKQLNDLNSTKGLAANRTKKSALKTTKKSPIPNIAAPKPGVKICCKSNVSQSPPGSSKVTEKPIWRH